MSPTADTYSNIFARTTIGTRTYELTDHLGNVTTTILDRKELVCSDDTFYRPTVCSWTDYYPFGYPMSECSWRLSGYRYGFNGQESDNEFYAEKQLYTAEFWQYDSRLGRRWNVDPVFKEFESPYSCFAGNPMWLVDPEGMNESPIYDTDGNFMGTDDQGLQGEAIVLNKSDFKQGMSHYDAVSKSTELNVINRKEAEMTMNSHYSTLKERPDYDGYLTLSEANDWYRNGQGQPLFTDLNKIDLSGIVSLGDNYVGQVKTFNLLNTGYSANDGLVYGNITLKRYPNHTVRAYSDTYDFDMKSWKNPLNWGRNIETKIGKKIAGQGTAYEIIIYGTQTLKPIIPFIK